ncbi:MULTISPECIES: hypothetical protein [Brevibacillus]|uniref:hypothetical protein n=1 Tax=Brevibacillus TaxID=55080 RepID=UPI0020C391D2|nr:MULTISPECIES: hypothetical protein [unclassified Brevibacillus]
MINLIKIEKLEEVTKYEDPKTSHIHHGGKDWTNGVPLILIKREGGVVVTDQWVFINNNGELVYEKKNNKWARVNITM